MAGAVFEPDVDECSEDVKVTAMKVGNGRAYQAATDGRGDFWLRDAEPGDYTLLVEKPGYLPQTMGPVDASQDVNVGDIAVRKAQAALAPHSARRGAREKKRGGRRGPQPAAASGPALRPSAPATSASIMPANAAIMPSSAAMNAAWTAQAPSPRQGPPRSTHEVRRLSPSIASTMVRRLISAAGHDNR